MKKLTFNQWWKEVEKLERRAAKINKISGNRMILVVTRLKRKGRNRKINKK